MAAKPTKPKTAPSKTKAKTSAKPTKAAPAAKKPAPSAKPVAKSVTKPVAKPVSKATPAKKPAAKSPAPAAKKPAAKPAAKPVAKKPAAKPAPAAKKAPAPAKKPAPMAVKPAAPAKPAPKAAAPEPKPAPVKAATPAKPVAPAKPAPAAKVAVVKKSSLVDVPPPPPPVKPPFVPPPKPAPVVDLDAPATGGTNGATHSAAFIQKQKQRLLDLRDELVDSMSGMTRDTIRNAPEGSEASGSGQHQGDAGSDAYDRDFALSVLAKEQDALYEIEQALRRIQAGTYGICEISSRKIPQARLEAIPFARLTVECQAQWEKEYGKRRFRPSNEVGFSGGNYVEDEDSETVSLDEDED
jgi:RNA polymerase-binding transcription factor DksA